MTEPTGNVLGTRFEKVLIPIEGQLRLELDVARAAVDHSLSIGEQVEAALRDTLRRFVPPAFGVGHGKIYDAYGDTSAQTDLIVTNPDNPYSFPDDKSGWYIIDGVAAAGEVKSVLTIPRLKDCISKGARYKQLRLSFHDDDVVMAGENSWEYLRQTAGVAPFIVVAFENEVAVSTLREMLTAAPLVPAPAGKNNRVLGNAALPPVDAVCVLGRGVAFNYRPSDMLGATRADTGEPVSGWYWIPTEAPLAYTLGWLHIMMPRIPRGTSPLAPYVFPSPEHRQYMQTRQSFETETVDGT